MRKLPALAFAWMVLGAPAAHADPPCGAVEFRFRPGAWNLQIVAWIEDGSGGVVDTAYITRATGQFGIANRPGAALLKTDCGWPYGRREMVLPVWAHRRNHHYPKIVMGGACGNSPSSQCGSNTCGGNCDDTTIAYHGLVSSDEPYFCAPQGCVPGHEPDVVSCATPVRTLSKGAYLDPTMKTAWSLYPPRADITKIDPNIDSPDVLDFAKRNDLVAVSQATPRPMRPLGSPIYWYPQQGLPEGDYVAWLEVSQEADQNGSYDAKSPHPNQDDSVSVWNGQGHWFLGQPSIVYKVPFHFGAAGVVAGTSDYAGYGAWDGQDGALRPPDATITVDKDGTGLGRLLVMPGTTHRVEVAVGACPVQDGGVHICNAPPPPLALTAAVNKTGSGIDFSLQVPPGVDSTYRFAVHYRKDGDPFTDANFDDASALVGPTFSATMPGDTLKASIDGLVQDAEYQVGARTIAGCGTRSTVTGISVKSGRMKFAQLSGCFVATAAWGSPLEREVGRLRAFRDGRLLDNPAGRLFVAGYYAFAPSLANAIAPDPRLRALARSAIVPLVAAIERLP